MELEKDEHVGKKFNKLTILGHTFKSTKSTKKQKYYSCQCDCGRTKDIISYNVLSGHIKSCGCVRNMQHYDEYIGHKFNDLTILELFNRKKGDKPTYRCLCDCGNEKIAEAFKVVSGGIKSCGCRASQDYKSLIGTKINKLELLELFTRNSLPHFKARCECNNITIASAHKIVSGHTKSCGCLVKESMSKMASNPKNVKSRYKYKWYFVKDGKRINCRSSYEVIYANFLINKDIKFQYEPEVFKLGNGIRYTPDFYLEDSDTYIEVKGELFSTIFNKQSSKIKIFKQNHKLEMVVWDDLSSILGMECTTDQFIRRAKQLDKHEYGSVEDWYANSAYLSLKDIFGWREKEKQSA